MPLAWPEEWDRAHILPTAAARAFPCGVCKGTQCVRYGRMVSINGNRGSESPRGTATWRLCENCRNEGYYPVSAHWNKITYGKQLGSASGPSSDTRYAAQP